MHIGVSIIKSIIVFDNITIKKTNHILGWKIEYIGNAIVSKDVLKVINATSNEKMSLYPVVLDAHLILCLKNSLKLPGALVLTVVFSSL